MRYRTCAALALLLVLSKSAIGSEIRSAQQYTVTVVLDEIPLPRSKQEAATRANPRVMLVANEEAILDVGGESKLGEKTIPFGTLFKVKVTQPSGKKVRVTGMLDVSSVGKVDDEMVPRESFSIHFDKTVELGHKTRVCVSKTSDKERWFELLVDEPKNLRRGNVTALSAAVPETVAKKPASSNRSRDVAK